MNEPTKLDYEQGICSLIIAALQYMTIEGNELK